MGAFLDPLGDKLLIVCAVVLLARPTSSAEQVVLPSWVAVVAIGKDLVVIIGFLLIYLSLGRVLIQPRRLGKLCTTSQLLLVLIVLFSPELRQLSARGAEWCLRCLWWSATALAVAAALASAFGALLPD